MGLEKLISIAAALAVLAATIGQLPRAVIAVRKAQIQLIQDSKASRRGLPMMLKNAK